jgi:7-carboxy-7-deazaguanine synthase
MEDLIKLTNVSPFNIKLTENGIYPITKDVNNEDIKNVTILKEYLDTGYDIPGTIINEGKMAGTPCIKIRMSGCNLHCAWGRNNNVGSICDSPNASYFPESNIMSIENVVNTVKYNLGNIEWVCITGGEPFTQGRKLNDVMIDLKNYLNCKLYVETNATIYIPEIIKIADFISMSPKLRTSTPLKRNLNNTAINYNENHANKHEKNRINLNVINRLSRIRDIKDNADFDIKFVISDNIYEDLKEIDYIVDELFKLEFNNINRSDIILIPEGFSQRELIRNEKLIIKECLSRGFRFSLRQATLLFGNKENI